MKLFGISDNTDTYVGLALAGIHCVVVQERQEILDQLEQVLQEPDIGILVVTQKIAKKIPQELVLLKKQRKLPLIVEIPDRHIQEERKQKQ